MLLADDPGQRKPAAASQPAEPVPIAVVIDEAIAGILARVQGTQTPAVGKPQKRQTERQTERPEFGEGVSP
jgi:hypothetical protein